MAGKHINMDMMNNSWSGDWDSRWVAYRRVAHTALKLSTEAIHILAKRQEDGGGLFEVLGIVHT